MSNLILTPGTVPLILASFAFTVGGIFMKQADGMRHVPATILFLLLFALGAAMLSQAMRGADLGATYIVGTGLESVLVLLFGIVLFSEAFTFPKLFGVLLIFAGVALLRAQ